MTAARQPDENIAPARARLDPCLTVTATTTTNPTDLAADRALAVAHCGLCDDDGYRGARPCDHVDRSDTYARGMAAVRAAIERGGA